MERKLEWSAWLANDYFYEHNELEELKKYVDESIKHMNEGTKGKFILGGTHCHWIYGEVLETAGDIAAKQGWKNDSVRLYRKGVDMRTRASQGEPCEEIIKVLEKLISKNDNAIRY